jgi:hypothetical protein
MDEENDELTVPGLDFAQLSDPTKLLGMVQSTYDRQLEALNRSETNAKARFDAAEARIRERNRGPSQSEQLFMLSKALLAPRDYRGFGGTMGKISGAFGNIAEADEKAREQRDAQLAALQDAYAAQGDAFGVTRAKTAADTLKTAVPLFKKTGKKTYDSTRGVFVDDTDPRPTENVYDIGGGRTLVQWQDGLWREPLAKGGYKVFERAGDKFKELGIEGPR